MTIRTRATLTSIVVTNVTHCFGIVATKETVQGVTLRIVEAVDIMMVSSLSIMVSSWYNTDAGSSVPAVVNCWLVLCSDGC